MPTVTPPPPIPRSSLSTVRIVLIGVGVLIAIFWVIFTIHSLIASGITKGPDNLFGDQHLKTAVALIELHKIRYGKYPASLDKLKFSGEWDQIALRNVSYYPNSDGTAYFIEVERGWIAKPKLEMPSEFWKGTGYSPSLNPNK
jgi:hypothetical protein